MMENALREKWMRLLLADPASPLGERYLCLEPERAEFFFALAEGLDTSSRRAALRLLDLGPALLNEVGRKRLSHLAALAGRAAAVSAELACRVLEAGGPALVVLGPEQRERWLDAGLDLARLSERTARAYFEAGTQVWREPPGLDPQIWGAAALPLLEAGWPGRGLAARFLETSAPFAARLGALGLGLLAESAARIARRHTPLAAAWIEEGPALLAEVPEGARPGVLELLGAASHGPPAAFGELARQAVSLAQTLEAPAAETLLRIAGALYGEEPEEALDLLRQGPRLLARAAPGRTDPWRQGTSQVLAQALVLRERYPAAAAALVRALPELRRLAVPSEIARWAAQGRRLAEQSPARAVAYFSLASRSSRAQLGAFAEGIAYAGLSRPMALFAQALCGRHVPLAVLAGDGDGQEEGPPAPSDRPLPTTDGLKIYLPELTWGFGTRHDNRRAARVATAHQVGHFEFGTFTFDAHRLARRRSPIAELSRFAPPPGGDAGLSGFFGRFPVEVLARDFFATFEGHRIEQGLRRCYRGLRADLDWLCSLELGRRPRLAKTLERGGPLSLLCELLIRRSLGAAELPGELAGEPAGPPSPERGEQTRPAWPPEPLEFAQLWDDLGSFLKSLETPQASVEDSAQRTAELYRLCALFVGTGAPGGALIAAHDEPEAPRQGDLRAGEIAAEIARAYEGFEPVPHRGQVDPAAAQQRMESRDALDLLEGAEPALGEMGPEDFERFLAAHPELIEAASALEEGPVSGGVLVERLAEMESERKNKGGAEPVAFDPEALARLRQAISRRLPEEPSAAEDIYLYDEWDHSIGDYRASWCTVREREGAEQGPEEMERLLGESAEIVAGVIRQFERIRPEVLRRERSQPDGEEIDLARTIEARADRRRGRPWPDRLYERRVRAERDVATLLLIDMSASTGERVPEQRATRGPETAADADYWWERPAPSPGATAGAPRTVLDIEKQALLVMSRALEYLGDAYAIYGFSGHGRERVELHRIKDFGERSGHHVLRRVAGIRPRQSTRMGAAIRHANWRLSRVEARYKSLIVISDGYPQDSDYGADRRDETYALLDTRAALGESERAGIHPFCVTVDKAGYDYLRTMSPHESYLVIDQVTDLPRVLPRVYRKMTW